MASSTNIMVFVEQHDRQLADVSLELICAARRLSDRLGGHVEAVVMGTGLEPVLGSLGHYGCRTVHYFEDDRLSQFTSVPYAKLMCDAIRTHQPGVVLFGATTTGRDLAPRVASALRCGLTADCTDLQIGEHRIRDRRFENVLLQIRPAFGGNIVATIVSPESTPSMATVREGVMKLDAPDPSGSVTIAKPAVNLVETDFPTEIIDLVRREKSVNLKSANIIVSMGMGAASADGIANVKALARTLGGVVGASRPVVDAGILPKAHQVGQTGTTVRPNLYIACGISGQIQHRAGMVEAKRIIAINHDPNAPIFDIAHYGIVGDVNDVIPRMINAYKEK